MPVHFNLKNFKHELDNYISTIIDYILKYNQNPNLIVWDFFFSLKSCLTELIIKSLLNSSTYTNLVTIFRHKKADALILVCSESFLETNDTLLFINIV